MRNSILSIAALASFAFVPSAYADMGAEFICTIPASSGFDCNQLRQRFFGTEGIPFVKDVTRSPGSKPVIIISLSRVPVQNGYDYETTVNERGTANSLKFKTFIADGANPVSAQQQINAVMQKGVLVFARPAAEAVRGDDKEATLVYRDPNGTVIDPTPKPPKSDGPWTLTPSADFFLNKYSSTPITLNASGGARFSYSGKRNRYLAGVNGSYNRQSVPVSVDGKQQMFGVNTYSAVADGGAIIGLDNENHFNLAVAADAWRSELSNLDLKADVAVSVEYNPYPILDKESKSFAVGCWVNPAYYDFAVTNILEKDQLFAIRQGCMVTGSVLLDKKRSTVVSGRLGENWIMNHPSFFGIDASVSATIRLTDRFSFSPSVQGSWKPKASITTASDKNLPNYDDLSPSEKAHQSVVYSAQSASGAGFGYSVNGRFSYTFGDGVTTTSQDQRGSATY